MLEVGQIITTPDVGHIRDLYRVEKICPKTVKARILIRYFDPEKGRWTHRWSENFMYLKKCMFNDYYIVMNKVELDSEL